MENNFIYEPIPREPVPQEFTANVFPFQQPLSEEELRNKALRKEANTQGGALLIYKVIMNVAVAIVMVAAAFIWAMEQALGYKTHGDAAMEQLADRMMAASGWGYLLAIGIGLLILLLWKKPRYFRQEIGKRGKPMTMGSFLTVLCLFMSGQFLYQIGAYALEALLQLFDISFLEFLEENAVDTSSLSMLLYVGIGAPIAEEILFRGLMLRSLEPYGKKFSIFVTAMFFGLYHGSPLQSVYAMVVGFVLGYVAMEYNIVWAMILHMINNLIFADALPRVLELLPYGLGEDVMQLITIAFFVAGAILALVKRKQIAEKWKQERIARWQNRAFFCAPTVIILMVSCALDMLLFSLMLLFM